MSKNERLKLNRSINESDQQKDKRQMMLRKRNLTKSGEAESPNAKATKIQKSKIGKGSVRRKIDFNDSQQVQENKNSKVKTNENEKQVNNNASLTRKLGEVKDRTRSKKGQECHVENVKDGKTVRVKSQPEKVESNRVQWTKEFMEKVRKSNERHNRKSKSKRSNVDKQDDSLLQNAQTRGDGIEVLLNVTDVEVDEELDYEDDVSVDGIDEDLSVPMDEPGINLSSPKPGTSFENTDIDLAPQQRLNEGVDGRLPLQKNTDMVDLNCVSEEKLLSNPVLQRMMEKYFDERFKDIQQKNTTGRNKIKSPSDTTIYAPALQKRLTPQAQDFEISRGGYEPPNEQIGANPQNFNMTNDGVVQRMQPLIDNMNGKSMLQQNNQYSDQIDAFLGAVRADQNVGEQCQPQGSNRVDRGETVEMEQARSRAERTLLEAEKFKATVEPLQTGNDKDLSHILNIGSGVSDDDFFHLTCHIEPSLIHKIEKGEFVELEKLLPKDRFRNHKEEGRLEWVQRDGGTFLVLAQKDNKIGGFRRWEQAFRAYATIYCVANPHRAKEIWQYITVINTAASSYVWDNVYNYDITFRHLMAFNPQRSWAITYNQMWNLSMKDPIPRFNSKSGYGSGSGFPHYNSSGTVLNRSNNTNSNTSTNPMQVMRNKSDYCWNFNKGIPCKFGSKCKFIERCKYCDSPTHGVHACHKLQKKDNGHGNNSGPGKSTVAPTQESQK